MCGIAGYIEKKQEFEKTSVNNLMEAMLNVLFHRGPDAVGKFVGENVALGHRRLSIVDLSDAGNQPMFSNDKQYIIVFNGEIYNYVELRVSLEQQGAKFSSGSDTEVILEAYRLYGEKCTDYFNGMWSFALYDTKKQGIFLSRDRFGVKPLYYLERKDVFVFASECKAILEALPDEKVVNENKIFNYFLEKVEDSDEETFYANIKRVLPGCAIWYDLRTHTSQIYQYYKLDINKCHEKWIKGKNPQKTFISLIEDAIRIRLRADVEVGACLSGGLDSSLIVSIANKKWRKRIHTFSAIYEEEDCNEQEFIEEVNRDNDTIPHPIYPQMDENFMEDMFRILYYHDGPDGGASLYSQYSVMKGVKGKVKVVLDGQGADELFGGYTGYLIYRVLDIIQEGKPFSRIRAIKALSYITNEWRDLIQIIHSESFEKVIGKKCYRYLRKKGIWKKKLNSTYDRPIFEKDFQNRCRVTNYNRFRVSDRELDNRLYHSIYHGLPDLLHNEDNNSMAHSIETRLPFLDYRIVEFAVALDGKYKIRNEWTKWIIRKSSKKYLTNKIRLRKNKMGFPAPFAKWLREGKEREQIKEMIFAFGKRGILDPDTIALYYQQHMENEVNRERFLYRVFKAEMWYRDYIEK